MEAATVYIECHSYKSLTPLILFRLIETFPYKCHPLCLYWKSRVSAVSLYGFRKRTRKNRTETQGVVLFSCSRILNIVSRGDEFTSSNHWALVQGGLPPPPFCQPSQAAKSKVTNRQVTRPVLVLFLLAGSTFF